MINWVIQRIELQAAKNIVDHHFKLQANKIKAAMVCKNDPKVRQTKKSHGVKIESGTEGNNVKIGEDISNSRNVNVTLI